METQPEDSTTKSKMKFEIINTMSIPTDSMIALAARVSHGGGSAVRTDRKLVEALREGEHFSPFSHINLTIFVDFRSDWHKSDPVLAAVGKYLLGGLHTLRGGDDLYESPFLLLRNANGGNVGLMRISLIHLLNLLYHTTFDSMYTVSDGSVVPHGYTNFPSTPISVLGDINDERFAVWYIPRLIAKKVLDGNGEEALVHKESAIYEELSGYTKELDAETFGYDYEMAKRLNKCNRAYFGKGRQSTSKMTIWASDGTAPAVLFPTDYDSLGFLNLSILDRMHTVTFKVDNMPLYIANQFLRHRRDVCVSQMSGRYSSFGMFVGEENGEGLLDTWLDMDAWRVTARKADARTAKLFDWSEDGAAEARQAIRYGLDVALRNAILLEEKYGVAKECVREVLPIGAHTKMVITMSMEAVLRVIKLRGDGMAQKEWGAFVSFLIGVHSAYEERIYGSYGE